MKIALYAPFVAGCFFGHVFHLEENAPGTGTVRTKPSDTLGIGERIRPGDPGERIVSIAPEVTFGGGVWEGDWSWASEAELGWLYGERPSSHISDEVLAGDMRVIPLWSIGGSFGYDLLELGQADRRLTLGVRATDEMLGLEAGWGWEPTTNEHSAYAGFFLSSWARFFYVRMLWGPERGLGAESGIAIDYALTWVWSR